MNTAPILNALLAQILKSSELENFSSSLQQEITPQLITAPLGIHPFYQAAAAQLADVKKPLVIITPTSQNAEDVKRNLEALVPDKKIAIFPAWETLPHERLSPRADTVASRLETLYKLANPAKTGGVEVLIAPVRALIQPFAKGLEKLTPVRVAVKDQVPLDELAKSLTNAAYTRVDMVSARGEYAVRGGILDVFVPTEAHPMRIEFFGDEIDEIRYFSVADQRSLPQQVQSFTAVACREILLDEKVKQRAQELIPSLPGLKPLLAKLAAGIAVEGMESITAVLVEEMTNLAAILPANTRVIFSQMERLKGRVDELVHTTAEFLAAAWHQASEGGEIPIQVQEANFLTLAQAMAELAARDAQIIEINPFGLAADINSKALSHPGFPGSITLIAKELKRQSDDKWISVISTAGSGTAAHYASQLREEELITHLQSGIKSIGDAGEYKQIQDLKPGGIYITTGPFVEGFVLEDAKIQLLTERDLNPKSARRNRSGKKLAVKRRNAVDPLQLQPGDYVVHEHHGVGKFKEMTSRTVGSGDKKVTREYLVIEYAPAKRGQSGDLLYVPSDQLAQVTKYVGGQEPSVNKMGGSDWAKTKSRARRAIREIADELVRLYSARQQSKGYAFSVDTPWQSELEDAFEFAETPDQLSTIEDVKRDMEKPLPMDRLICGDVGFGKTEIAIRAAFKAVQDGKQVAVLCPTTLLVQQHVETFSERYAGFPVRVRALSRFQSKKESEEVVKGLKEGSVDVVIGTHRLITGQVRFKDLGLVIVDEEQRFGVEHKETLKAMRTNVDVLSMSATPIPRTLEMAVTGIRELSTLATPPEERHPVLTYVGGYDDAQIKAAIRRELLREGQVFFIHNRVEDIEAQAQKISELIPDASVAVAHGKMNENQLERVILDFWEKRFDVLVCTTIVETGLDISNANTLIVNDAQRFGLSQLHQLRGRVGRSRERAYAYFLYPPTHTLTETAHERLSTLATHSELGAGMQVAMKDLEIRGAGNLLGGEQSGHIAGVGFDLYVRMVGEAVSAFKGEKLQLNKETKVELPVNAHIPHDYVESERLRLEAYAKISASESEEQINQISQELKDRYGQLPKAAELLLKVASFKLFAAQMGLEEVQVQGKMIRFAHLEVPDSVQMKLKRLYPGTVLKPALRQVLIPHPQSKKIGGVPLIDEALLDWAQKVIKVLKAKTDD